jgi:SAM-dependent methyltransferase
MSMVKTAIADYWDWRSQSYLADQTKDENTQWERILRESLPTGPGKCALDIGTGRGHFAVYLARLGYKVTAVDLSRRMLDYARAFAVKQDLQIEFQGQDAEALTFQDGLFDVVVSRNVLWTLTEPIQALSDWRRVMKPGGHLLVSDGFWRNRSWRHLPELLRDLPRALFNAGSRIALRFFLSYAAIRHRLPFYEGIQAEKAVTMLAISGFSAIRPYRTQWNPYGKRTRRSHCPPYFILTARA